MGVGEKPISGMGVKPNIFHSILIFMLNIWGVDSKYRNTEIQQLSLCPSSGPKCPPLKNGHLGPRSVGPPDSWAPDILHISDKYKKLPKNIISRQFQHLNPEKFEQISLFMWNLFFPYQLYQKEHKYLWNYSRNLFTIRHFTHIWNYFTQALLVLLVTDIMSAQLFLFKAGLG